MYGPETILGYAQYEGDKYPFVYEKGILNLLPGSEVEWSKQKSKLLKSFMELSKFQVRHEWISNKYIKGITNEGKKILFITKGDGSNNNGFIQYTIQVMYQYNADSLKGDLINGLIITADEIDYFFNPARAFNSEFIFNKDNGLQEIHVKSGRELNSTINCGNYYYEDISIEVEVSAYSTFRARSENPLSAQSQMSFEFNKGIELDKALEIINQQELFLRYICYRKNVNINTVKVFSRNDSGLRRTEGKIYIISEELLETDKKRNKQILTFEFLQEKIIHLFQAIADGKVYSQHICSSMGK